MPCLQRRVQDTHDDQLRAYILLSVHSALPLDRQQMSDVPQERPGDKVEVEFDPRGTGRGLSEREAEVAGTCDNGC
jgi:hypothetical protein